MSVEIVTKYYNWFFLSPFQMAIYIEVYLLGMPYAILSLLQTPKTIPLKCKIQNSYNVFAYLNSDSR